MQNKLLKINESTNTVAALRQAISNIGFRLNENVPDEQLQFIIDNIDVTNNDLKFSVDNHQAKMITGFRYRQKKKITQ